MNIKYTSDGRKVLVVGQLNATQHIVQEIFVSGDQEIPSGENFVVSNLHDKPSESWKEKNLRELEERYDKARKDAERRTNEVNNNLAIAESKAKQRAVALMAFTKNADNEQLDTLRSFVAGEITHFFIDCAYSPEIVAWDDNKVYDTDSWGRHMKADGMKLVSLFGKSDGRLDYRLHAYSDGSGGSKSIVPCTSYEDALSKAQESLDAAAFAYVDGARGNLYVENWMKIEGIKIPEDALAKYNSAKRKNQLARIEKLQDEIEKIEADLATVSTGQVQE